MDSLVQAQHNAARQKRLTELKVSIVVSGLGDGRYTGYENGRVIGGNGTLRKQREFVENAARFETERRHLEAMSQAAQQRSDARLRAAELCRKVNVSTLTFLHRSNCPNLSLRCVGLQPGCTRARRPSARPALSEAQETRRLRSRQIFQQPAPREL